jgi:hypothetical protein
MLRSGCPAGVEQEMWALLAVYQALRIAVTDAVQSVPGLDPDRAGWQAAVETAQNLVTTAQNITDPGVIARPDRRHRPRRPGQPARAPAASRLRPQGQVPAQPLEQAPRRETPHNQANNQHHQPHRPETLPAPDTPTEIRDKPFGTLTSLHCL